MTVQANTAPLQSQIAHWEAHHNRRLLIYLAGEGGTSAKGIDERDVLPLYTALRAIGNQEQLDILLFSGGGRVNSSRRICLLFREYTSFLRIFVPYKARSAGTLLCLGSDEFATVQKIRSSLAEWHIGSLGSES
jgi:ClpP class serine protease